jgi:hypothetical protein
MSVQDLRLSLDDKSFPSFGRTGSSWESWSIHGERGTKICSMMGRRLVGKARGRPTKTAGTTIEKVL